MKINSFQQPELGQPSVAILMCTYNGEKYLRAQLKSFEEQTHKNWRLIVSDDGSIDGTLRILEEFAGRWGEGKLSVRIGPKNGFCANFLSLAADTQIEADCFAFSDQDDVWLPRKLEAALDKLNVNHALPYLYCGRTTYVKDDLRPYSMSPLFVFPGTFRNALVQSIAGGNTMVFNKPAKKLIEAAGRLNPASHDWWLYMMITAAGGEVFYDPESFVLYRQHPNALVGGNNSLLNKVERIGMVVQGRFKKWTDQNLQALIASKHLMTSESRKVLELFVLLRASNLKERFRMLEVCGLHRQTWRGTISLIFAALFNKL
jgi:glycosyltransferase involved in cell wall biosynthesis